MAVGERILQTAQGHTFEEPQESISLGWKEWEPGCFAGPMWLKPCQGGKTRGAPGKQVYEILLSSKHFAGVGEGLPPKSQVERRAGGKE